MVIGRGRRREHPNDTSEGVTWPSITTGVAQLPVAHVHTQGNPEGVKRPSVTSGSHVTTTKKKARGKSRACVEPISGQDRFRTLSLPILLTILCKYDLSCTNILLVDDSCCWSVRDTPRSVIVILCLDRPWYIFKFLIILTGHTSLSVCVVLCLDRPWYIFQVITHLLLLVCLSYITVSLCVIVCRQAMVYYLGGW